MLSDLIEMQKIQENSSNAGFQILFIDELIKKYLKKDSIESKISIIVIGEPNKNILNTLQTKLENIGIKIISEQTSHLLLEQTPRVQVMSKNEEKQIKLTKNFYSGNKKIKFEKNKQMNRMNNRNNKNKKFSYKNY